ncbi:chloride channel protein [Rhodoferax sp. GW822-FHT02A01]|uniref:chloride channel protein n=1 Tax=Rhodoferax sp. GW822-FHT02A01 TaxID=3141537 RepID=UPI00315C854F
MSPQPHIGRTLRKELSDWRRWVGRTLVLVFASTAGLTVVAFTWLSERALAAFHVLQSTYWWAPLLWTPFCTMAIAAITRRWLPGIAGSGIPQVIAALEPEATGSNRGYFVSLRLSIAKIAMTAWGLLAGLSLGREGPSVQIAAGVLHHARRWIPESARVSDQALLIAGGAAGIAAAFNTPLGGVMFAIEELSRRPEQRSNGLVLAAIVFSGLMAVSIYGNATYFGVIRIDGWSTALIWPGLVIAVVSGVLGGIFSRLMLTSMTPNAKGWCMNLRRNRPIAFAGLCALLIALMGVTSDGSIFGSGYMHTRQLLESGTETFDLFVPFKFLATWLTTWSGVPGGIFAPSLAIGGSLGQEVSQWLGVASTPAYIALGMAGFLAAVTQAPLTAFIIVMEMVDGHALVLSLMTCAFVACGVSRFISVPLYPGLALLQLKRLPAQSQGIDRN